MNRIKVAEPSVGKEELKALEEVLYSGNYISGSKVCEFENEFSKYCNTDYGIATNSGTSALHIALASYGIGPGDEVIVPAITFFSTATSILHQNAIPIFADIDIKSYTIDPNDINDKISDKTKAIIPVHLFGNPADMDQINAIAKDHNLFVIEDCAQAHGAVYKGKRVGEIGDCGCFSFFATKNITTGEGGIIVTNDENFANKCKKIRSHGMSDRNTHDVLGYNYRMNEFEAAMGLVQLNKLDRFNQRRRNNSYYLYERLKDINWIIIPEIKSYVEHVFFWCPIQINEKKLGMNTTELRNELLKQGIETRHRYNSPLNNQKLLIEKNAYTHGCPFTCPYYNK
jgi:dTDP-4-amino-4,6-dideoxygalactose transaminase